MIVLYVLAVEIVVTTGWFVGTAIRKRKPDWIPVLLVLATLSAAGLWFIASKSQSLHSVAIVIPVVFGMFLQATANELWLSK
jgi:uncharacterized membrane protein YoaK (UPF0700 family)